MNPRPEPEFDEELDWLADDAYDDLYDWVGDAPDFGPRMITVELPPMPEEAQ